MNEGKEGDPVWKIHFHDEKDEHGEWYQYKGSLDNAIRYKDQVAATQTRFRGQAVVDVLVTPKSHQIDVLYAAPGRTRKQYLAERLQQVKAVIAGPLDAYTKLMEQKGMTEDQIYAALESLYAVTKGQSVDHAAKEIAQRIALLKSVPLFRPMSLSGRCIARGKLGRARSMQSVCSTTTTAMSRYQ